MIDMADELYRIYRVGECAARREYKCDECSRPIPAGECYQRVAGLSYDGWDTWHMCLHCAWASKWLVAQCGGFMHGAVLEDLEEHWHEDPLLATMDLGRRIVGMRRRWQGFDGQLMRLEALAA